MATLQLTHTISGYDWEGKTRVYYKTEYDSVKNQTTVTFSESDFYYRGLSGYSTSATAKITVTAVDNTSSSKTAQMSISNTTDGGYDRFPATPSPKSVVVQHSASAGEKSVKIACTSTINVYVGTSNQTQTKKSGSVTVETGEYYPASSLTAANGTLGTAKTLQVSKNVDSFTHTIKYSCGTASGTICSKSSDTAITWTPPLSLASQNTTGTSVPITLIITTYDGDSNLGSKSAQITCVIPASVKPSLTLTVNDATGAKDIYGAYVKGLSMFDIVAAAETAYGSPIASYKITANGGTYTEAEIRTGFLQTAGQQTISATVTDGRNRSASDSVSVNVLDYEKPVISALSVRRCNSDGTANDRGEYALVKFSAKVTALSNMNSAEYVLNYRKTNAVDWYGVALDDLYNQYTVTDYTCVIPADSADSYVVEVTVSDNHIATPKSVPLSTGNVIMHFAANGRAISVGKICEKQDAFEVGWAQYDRFGTLVGSGLAAYTGGGNNGIDPDTTLEELCLTSHTHAPQGKGTFYFIHTSFYSTKSATASRAQFAYPYKKHGSAYHRYFTDGAWSTWESQALQSYPVGSYYISHNDTSPASLFGGTWHRIESRFLWAAPASSELGKTAGEQTHKLTVSEMPAHTHGINARAVYAGGGTYSALARQSYGEATTDGMLSVGGGAAHNNMPPYVTVAIWRRTA